MATTQQVIAKCTQLNLTTADEHKQVVAELQRLRDLVTAKDQEIFDLKQQITELQAELAGAIPDAVVTAIDEAIEKQSEFWQHI